MRLVKKYGGVIVSGLLFMIALGLWVQRQDVYDWLALRNYHPSERIVAVADKTAMSEYGRKLFYLHDPKFESKLTFRNYCEFHEASIVLGCYISNGGIYILDVTDERLAGIHEVTAAHEMLHAAYNRLSGDERLRVDQMTSSYFATMTNERVTKAIEQYRALDTGVIPNELHSILATEIRDLSPELEEYYKQYFDDRLSVVLLSEQYESVFTSRKEKVAEYDDRLGNLRQNIEQTHASLGSRENNIVQERKRLDSLLSQEKFEEYNQSVASFNALVRAYNAELNSAQALIRTYNELVAERNAIAAEQHELMEAIDSRLEQQATE